MCRIRCGGGWSRRPRCRRGARSPTSADELPHQVIHCDITDDNVVCSADDGHLADGIIDFGDLTRSWAVGELAVTVSSVLRHAGGEPVATLPLIAAFDHERPLQPAEIAALWPLLVLRAATLVVSGNQQAAIDAENDYATGALELEWRIFERAVSVPADVMAGVIADALGRPAPLAVPLSVSAPLLGGVDPGAVRRLDFSAQSDTVDAGAWLDPACEERAAAAALTDGALAAVTAYAEPRLTRSVALHSESSDTVPTGVDLWLAGQTALTAPFAGLVVTAGDGEVILAGENGALVGARDVGASGRFRGSRRVRRRCARHRGPGPAVGSGERGRRHRGAGVRPPGIRAGVAHPDARSRTAAGPAPHRGGRRGRRRPGPPSRPVLRRRAGAVLPAAAADRARLARVPGVGRRPQLRRHGQQRGGHRPRTSGPGRRRRAAVAPAQHQFAVQLRRGGGLLGAAGSHPARSAGHRLPGQLGLGGRRSRHCAWRWPSPAAGM